MGIVVFGKQGFCWVIIMASVWETMAFTFRAISTKYQQSTGVYLVFQGFILLAPLCEFFLAVTLTEVGLDGFLVVANILLGVNAFDYMIFGRMIYYYLPSRRLLKIRAPIIASVFVGLDIISFIIQLVGGNMAGPSAPVEDQLRAIHIYMGGIGLQELFIVAFLLLAITFHRKMNSLEGTVATRKGWRPLLLTLYVSLSLITVCSSTGLAVQNRV